VPIVLTGTEGTEKNIQKQNDAQKPTQGMQNSAAAFFESKLRSRLDGLLIADKVKTQVIGNTLTLTGQLTPIEHRKLLNQLHFVPAGVRIIDDIEYAEAFRGPAMATSAGWVWVRSEPRGAEIFLDNTDTGLRTPARIEVPQGQHAIALTLSSFAKALRTVEVQPGQTMQITQSLEKQ
jgi:hypothetical protein